ncbi:MAG: peptidase T [Ignavibacteriae bacterium]|nr:peptidase T [Ignavibacteriota bacterium]MCB9221046.1 peptidase T [Ignavibacteria bacterium]
MAEKVLDKFIRYAKIDTQSDPKSQTIPSTQKQFDLAHILVKELKEMGIKDVELTDECYIYATIPSNILNGNNLPTIGFVAHMDTSPDFNATGVNPQIVENYQGGDIRLGNSNEFILEKDNPNLRKCIGHTIITTDGTTLLSSDDKSGVSAIMKMAEILMYDDTIKHGPVKIGFTPDEEIGRGADKFDIEKFGCEYAYTIDGGLPGEINKETFSADSAFVTVTGNEIHPGEAKDRMVNSIRVISEIIAKLPKDMAPETTEGYQPYIHPHEVDARVGKSTLHLLFRDFNTDGLTIQKEIVEKIISEVQPNYPKAKIELEVTKSYRNMYDVLMENPKGLDLLYKAAEMAGTNPEWEPIRGGTDGSRLTEMGLPTPNIYTGGQNFHSNKEWLSLDFLEKTIETMINLVELWGKEKI